MIRLESIRRGGHERATGESPSVLDLAVHARRQPLGVSHPNAITVTPMLAGERIQASPAELPAIDIRSL